MLKVVGEEGRVTGMNVNENSIDDMLRHSDINNLFVNFDSSLISEECKSCPIFKWCGGGYLPTRYSDANGYANPSIYCEDLKMLFNHIGSWILNQKRKETILCQIV